MLIDFHTHKRRFPDAGMEIISVHPGRHERTPWYTTGYHPWWRDGLLGEEELGWLHENLQDPGCLAIGECGMDKLKGPGLSLQKQIFIQQVEVANAWNSPVVVHCVRAFHEVLDVHQSLAKTPWVIHGFVRNKTLAKQVLDRGIYLSLAPTKQPVATFEETLKYVPLDRIFLETDSETTWNIRERYQFFARLRYMVEEDLEKHIVDNLTKFMAWKWQNIEIGLSALNS